MPPLALLFLLIFQVLATTVLTATGQTNNILDLVNPRIGTTQARTQTMWGAEGGTYPGAVAPFGFMQLTPETRLSEPNGYDYRDSTIYFFSCTGHRSGYPNGSSGTVRIMPVGKVDTSTKEPDGRPFSHLDEICSPGYYKVRLSDDGTLAEATASVHAGFFRFTFPAHVKPRVYLGDMGNISIVSAVKIEGSKLHTQVLFNKEFIAKENKEGGVILTFPASGEGENILLVKVGSSATGPGSTSKNLLRELDSWDFDSFKASNEKRWLDQLSVVELKDPSVNNKTVFYTALYHSFLLPWIISDVDGSYRGADGTVHQAKGKNQYGGFSTWDTFRTLHPLLSLLSPDRQNDMILSLLDDYSQSGKLPSGPMTGHHPIPVIVDSYLKGITGYDSTLAFNAMRNSLANEKDEDFLAYQKMGYVPFVYSESVTKTVEYAYDDWALAQFAGTVMRDGKTAEELQKRSLAYRQLFHQPTLFLLPRLHTEFVPEPGNFGYKEGDKWIYSLFVPHNPDDLINLSGGKPEFAAHLDSALTRKDILFDNEPAFHVPYFFNYAGRPDKTQERVREILLNGFGNRPDGLPGNDDLGSMSSWYVFSALGIFPFCPGRPDYDIGSPLFEEATLRLQSGKRFTVRTSGNAPGHIYVKKLRWNGSDLNSSRIAHKAVTNGGILEFSMGTGPATLPKEMHNGTGQAETPRFSDFEITGFRLSAAKVRPDQSFYARFRVLNKGPQGTKIVRLSLDGKEFARKNVFVGEKEEVSDSIECRLYGRGIKSIRLGPLASPVELLPDLPGRRRGPEVLSLKATPACSIHEKSVVEVLVMNKNGVPIADTLDIKLDGNILSRELVTLNPGETGTVSFGAKLPGPGIHLVSAGPLSQKIKIYAENRESTLLEISPGRQVTVDTIPDSSGFLHTGLRKKATEYHPGSGTFTALADEYIELPHSQGLDLLKNKITVMAWVFPLNNKQLSDIVAKGDHIVLQSGGRTLTFFAGGWGRGVCESGLPADWANKWHHIAGVYDGNSLKLYIDGILSASEGRLLPGNLLSHQKWMVKRNEEFPEMRYFKGQTEHVKIFAEPLTDSEVRAEMLEDQPGEFNTQKTLQQEN